VFDRLLSGYCLWWGLDWVSDVVWSVACGKVAVTVGLNSDSGMPEMCPRADDDCLHVVCRAVQ
jgi:hypothetical protein